MFSPALHRHLATVLAAFACGGVLVVAPVAAAPALTSAQAAVRYAAPTTCQVALTVAITGASTIEHRLEVLDGAAVTLSGVDGASPARPVSAIGRTRSLVVTPAADGAPYTIRYEVQQTPSRPGRCPIWLPTAPANGRGRDVRVTVQLPEGSVASGTMPTFTWQGTTGSAVVPHLPAFVIVPYVPAGDSRPWDVSRVMDAAALTSLAVASVLWLRRNKGPH